ncbi:bifunctional sugar-1-phosphate nucleotidylyltransferase/acetyltransferase [Salinarchaeum laminariae]|uniref:bifunctional sugar-1-phosphate nucleotidylyltransferase/acetyltransferase n=1 Tax=Salinarchaeum laminariae TaxID=869888 RepID=UPI0020C071F0|nr:bifunctional sugar-1-phosphate nucleotidylyltransferase/acetyltransferase [Salinarchaeum laminariae]
MDAVIVAAGKGTRMRPLTDERPKPLLPVGTTTLLERTMGQCSPHVDRFVLVVGYRGDAIREAIGDTFDGAPVEYVEQRQRKGTAHAVGRAADVVDDRFIVCNGDLVLDDALFERLAATEGHALTVTTVPNPTEYGVVDVDWDAASTGTARVEGIVEKPDDPPSDLGNVGVYAFEPSIFDAIDRTTESPRGEFEITDSIELLLDDGAEIAAVEYDGTWLDVGRPWDLLTATETVLGELDGDSSSEQLIDGTVEDGADLHGPVVVENGARVRSGAYVEGPVVIRSGADVGPNAYVRGATVLGPDVRVGNGVEVKNSVLMAGAHAAHLSYVGDSVLGRDVNFGAGTVVANLRHDDANVRMRVKGEAVDTGRRKLGVVLGDGAKTGIDTSLNAGVVLGTGAATEPGETVRRDRGRE